MPKWKRRFTLGQNTKLYGIGKVFSKRIVKFRDKLGGFYDINQIAETYGLPDSTFQEIKPQLILSTDFSPLHINLLTEDQLAAHPYINWKQAKTLINYRFHHGAYKNVEDIKASMAFKDSTLVKVKPYLSFQWLKSPFVDISMNLAEENSE